jgi:hypothetical protein
MLPETLPATNASACHVKGCGIKFRRSLIVGQGNMPDCVNFLAFELILAGISYGRVLSNKFFRKNIPHPHMNCQL